MSKSKNVQPPLKVNLITVSRPAIAPAGKNVAIAFHAALTNKSKDPLPKGIAVGINGKSMDAYDLTGAGVYTVFFKVDKKKIPAVPAFYKPNAPVATPEFLHIKSIPCPPACESAIFGTRCVCCIEFSLDI